MEGGLANELWRSKGEEYEADSQLQRQVWDEMRWEPSLHFGDLRVEVNGRVARLTGSVPFFLDKLIAERAADRVPGLANIVNALTVCPPAGDCWPDERLRAAVQSVLAWNAAIPGAGVTATVAAGVVTLTGRVASEDQRVAAFDAVARLRGVRDVCDQVVVGWTSGAVNLGQRVSSALERDALLRGSRIQVVAHGAEITLHGRVHTLAERREAEEVTRRVPGVAHVADDLELEG